MFADSLADKEIEPPENKYLSQGHTELGAELTLESKPAGLWVYSSSAEQLGARQLTSQTNWPCPMTEKQWIMTR